MNALEKMNLKLLQKVENLTDSKINHFANEKRITETKYKEEIKLLKQAQEATVLK